MKMATKSSAGETKNSVDAAPSPPVFTRRAERLAPRRIEQHGKAKAKAVSVQPATNPTHDRGRHVRPTWHVVRATKDACPARFGQGRALAAVLARIAERAILCQ